MNLRFPSPEFDDAVAAVCHGSDADDQRRGLHELLRHDPAARDAYIRSVELHARLASAPELFATIAPPPESPVPDGSGRDWARPKPRSRGRRRSWRIGWGLLAAAGVALAVTGWLLPGGPGDRDVSRPVATSRAIAMLSQTADARWNAADEGPRLGAPLEAGWLRLEAGLAQVVLYSGARVVLEGPAELQLISPGHAFCRRGRLTAEVPYQARGFKIEAPLGSVTDLGSSFGLEVTEEAMALHVFGGSVALRATHEAGEQPVHAGSGALLEEARAARPIEADRAAFASLFDLRVRSLVAEAQRFARWQVASERRNRDPSLLVRFDFARAQPAQWRLPNVSARGGDEDDATIVGCQWVKGRWPEKQALEFRGVSDRVRMNVPAECEALTLAAWVRVQGLDRKLNALFMCDGFDAGTVHWLIRHDGVLGLTVVGEGSGNYQIVASPPVLTLDQFGLWVHLAVVLDRASARVTHYVNGRAVSQDALRIEPPYRIGTAELGNWKAVGFPEDDPFMIRNFSGAIDEFCLFGRALDAGEIRALHAEGKPETDAVARHD